MAEHTCHATNCTTKVNPSLLMCGRHWKMVPPKLQRQVWATYVRGQEIDYGKLTSAYMRASGEAIKHVEDLEGVPENERKSKMNFDIADGGMFDE